MSDKKPTCAQSASLDSRFARNDEVDGIPNGLDSWAAVWKGLRLDWSVLQDYGFWVGCPGVGIIFFRDFSTAYWGLVGIGWPGGKSDLFRDYQ